MKRSKPLEERGDTIFFMTVVFISEHHKILQIRWTRQFREQQRIVF